MSAHSTHLPQPRGTCTTGRGELDDNTSTKMEESEGWGGQVEWFEYDGVGAGRLGQVPQEVYWVMMQSGV